MWGPRWVQPGAVASRVEVADIAPTLAQVLGIPAPPASEGRPLPMARPEPAADAASARAARPWRYKLH